MQPSPALPTSSAAVALRPTSAARVSGGFWAGRMAANRAAIPLGYDRLEAAGNLGNLRIAAGRADGTAQGASFRSKELTELIVEGIRHPGFSFIDAFSPCTAFNNTTQEWKQSVYNLPAEHDSSDRAAAFAAALSDPMGIGIYYRAERPTLDGRVREMQDAAPAGSVAELVEAFAVRPAEPAIKPVY